MFLKTLKNLFDRRHVETIAIGELKTTAFRTVTKSNLFFLTTMILLKQDQIALQKGLAWDKDYNTNEVGVVKRDVRDGV